MKTGLVLLVCLTILCLPAASDAAERPILVVLGIHDESGSLDEELLNSLTEYLAASVAECGTYRIVPPWDVRPALLKKKLDAGKECVDPECQLKLAAQLNANLYVSTSITRTADTCTVVSALDDVKQQTQLIAARARGDCNEFGLVRAVEDVAYFFILWGGCRSPVRGEPEITEDVYQQSAEAGVQQPLLVKDRMHLPDVEEINGEQFGSVTDVMAGAGWTIHTGVGHGIRFDGRLFLNAFVDMPVLKDLGFGAKYSTYTGGGRSIDIPDDLRAGAMSQWQVEILYRLAFNQVLTRPALVFHLGYGGSGCLHDPGTRFLTGAAYRYPYLALEAYFMPYKPHIRMWLSSSVLFNVESSEERAEGSYMGLTAGIGVDLLPARYIYLGMGYELSRYYDEGWSSDLFVTFFLRAGCYYD